MSDLRGEWALILGASSGFGEATALELARRGMNICGVHMDRKGTLPRVEEIREKIRSAGGEAYFLNVNAADEEKRKEVLDGLAPKLGGRPIRTFLHSLAFGTLRPYTGPDRLTKAQMEMTLDVMAHSLVYWVQDLHEREMLRRGSRIFAMTSAGSQRVWATYGAVSAAKAALESHLRQLTLELGPEGISCNAVRAGVTDTPSLRKIPGHDSMIEVALGRNPMKRLTTPEDVAKIIATLLVDGVEWLTGNVLGADGGEFLT